MSSQPRILVIDDNRSLVHIVERLLQKEGFEVLTAFDGTQGLKKARRERPDLIILDIIMPGIDGYQVSRRLQAHPDTAAIPVLMFTVLGQTEVEPADNPGRYNVRVHQRLEGFECGALEFLSKPVQAKELLKRVKALLWTRGIL
jgi:DNA-binding response OmpR family regulator